MNGKAKIELLLELKNKLKTGLSKAREKVDGSVKHMKGKLTELKNHHVQAFRTMRAEIPLFSRALSIIGNPYVLITAGAIALIALLGKATNRAAEFNHEFLNVRQLNLDKSKKELDSYRTLVLDTAFEAGLGAKDTAKAFYDIQSATGLYGKEVASITAEVGKFSIATGAELPDAINQTVKAMKAFGLGAGDVKSLLESNAKTVQVGITTFAELARVQTEFAGAAAGAGQTVDTANKVFAAFTSIAKDSVTAATMTKTAFLGLTQKSTVDGLKSIGISLYDTNGQMRDLGAVLKEVTGKFKEMTPRQVDELINKIGGPEGLRSLFIKLKTGADDFFATMEAYDSSKFNLEKALKNAKGDFNVLKELVRNRLNVLMISLGQTILPVVLSGIEKFNNLLTWVKDNMQLVKAVLQGLTFGLGGAIVAFKIFNFVVSANPIGLVIIAIGALVAGIITLTKRTEGWSKSWQAIKVIMGIIWDQMKLDWNLLVNNITIGINILLLRFKSFGQYIGKLFSNIGESIKLAFKGDFSGAKEALTREITTEAGKEIEALKAQRDKLRKDYKQATKENAIKYLAAYKDIGITWKKKKEEDAEEQKEKESNVMASLAGTAAVQSPEGGNYDNTGDSINRVVGSAKQIKNIQVNIDAFNKGGINTQNTTLQNMDADQIEQWFSDMLMRTIRNVETNYS